MSVPELALVALGVLLCIGIILAVKEYIALRKALSQPVVYRRVVVFVQHESIPVFSHKYKCKVAAIWGMLEEEELSKEKSTRRNMARLRRNLIRRKRIDSKEKREWLV